MSETKDLDLTEKVETRQLSTLKNIPNLHQAEESPVDLSSEYWSPEEVGEFKLGVPMAIEDSIYVKEETGEELSLPCLIFVEQKKDGTLKAVRNGSKRLVACIENAVKAGSITLGESFVKIVFVGKEKNSTNAFKSDRWSVKPLFINSSKSDK